MDKKTIHKIKWQVVKLEGWAIHPRQANSGFTSLCCNSLVQKYRKKKHGGKLYHFGNGSIQWKNVTCKNCLKMRQ